MNNNRQARLFQQQTRSSQTIKWNIGTQYRQNQYNASFITQSVPKSILSVYRIKKPNKQLKIMNVKSTKPVFTNLICSFLGIQNQYSSEINSKQCKCKCPRTQDNLCQTVMQWIEEQYYWKTDPQFFKILAHYNRKKLQASQLTTICIKLQTIINILGLQLNKQWFNQIVQILANYWKHAQYYGKYDKLVAQSDIYIWVCLGIMYHIGFDAQQLTDQKKCLIFWALDIAMDKFQDLTVQAFRQHHIKTIKMFQYYYNKWIQILSIKGVNIFQVCWQFINEMMFGYMGIQNIVFFINCFKKIGWKYLHKIILSYFQQRSNELKKNENFDMMTTQQLLKILIDSNQQWPMIFCLGSTFEIVQ